MTKNLISKDNLNRFSILYIILIIIFALSFTFLRNQPQEQASETQSTLITEQIPIDKPLEFPSDFATYEDYFFATEDALYFLGLDNSKSTQSDYSPKNSKFLIYAIYSPYNNKDVYTYKKDMPVNIDYYVGVRLFQNDAAIYFSGYKHFSTQDRGYSIPEKSETYRAILSADNNLFEYINFSLPKETPLENGGYTLTANDDKLFLIINEDSPEYKIYQSTFFRFSPQAWEYLGTVPVELLNPQDRYYYNTKGGFSITSDKLVLFGQNETYTFNIKNNKIEANYSIKSLDNGLFESENQTQIIYKTIFGNYLALITQSKRANNKLTFNLYVSEDDDGEYDFKKQKTLNTDITASDQLRLLFSENNSNIYLDVESAAPEGELFSRKIYSFSKHN